MEAFTLYLLKSSVWLTGFAAIYFLFLRNERFFTLNRIFLVSGVLISVAFPFFTWHYTVIFPVVPTVNMDEPQIQAIGVANNSSFQTKDLLLYIYILGVSYLIFRLIKQTLSVWQLIRKSKPLHFNSIKLIHTNRYPASFSFFSFVFVNPSTHEHEINEIVNHEQEHIRQRHWIDLLLFEILCTIQWFNPTIWIYGRFIRQNHEFMADEQALRRTTNPAIYRAALLNQMFGAPVISLANSFNYSINKKRFNMMKQITYSPFRKLKLLLVLPLIAGVFYAFATPEYKFVQAKNESVQTEVVQSTGEIFQTELNEGTPAISENQKESPQKQSIANSSTVSMSDGKMIRGKVISEDGKPLCETSIIISGTTIGTMPDENGNFTLKTTDDSPIVFSFVGFQTQKLKPDFDKEMLITMKRAVIAIDAVGNAPSKSEIAKIPGPVPYLIIVDGKEISKEEMEKIHPSTIESISLLKQESATILYGEKGKNGVILITLKKEQATENQRKNTDVKVIGYGRMDDRKDDPSQYPNNGVRVRSFGETDNKPLLVIDGIISENKKIEDIAPETMGAVNILKGESAIAKYGEKGKNGIIEITTKSVLQNNQPLYVVDGNVINKLPSFEELSPKNIQSIKVLRGESAIAKYGEKGKNEIIEITTKSVFQNNQPLYVVNGNVISKLPSFEELSPKNIQSIEVLRGESATKIYGEKGKNGVVVITSKSKDSGLQIQSSDISGNPLIVVNDVISPNKKVEDINPEAIQSINILKGEKATQKYGEKGKDGVVEITLKKQDEVFVVVEQIPEFPGGSEAFHAYLNANFRYPETAIEKGICGKVLVSFVVSKTGAVTEVKVARGVDPALDAEAIRLVKTLPNWKPGKQRGVPVDFNYIIPVEFNLPTKK